MCKFKSIADLYLCFSALLISLQNKKIVHVLGGDVKTTMDSLKVGFWSQPLNCLYHWKMKVLCASAMLNQEAHRKMKKKAKKDTGCTLADTQSTERVEGAKREAGEARREARI